MQRVVFAVVLLCVGQWALGQDFDCSTSEGQDAYLISQTAPECYNPLLGLRVGTQPTAAEIEFVSEHPQFYFFNRQTCIFLASRMRKRMCKTSCRVLAENGRVPQQRDRAGRR